LLMQKTTRRRGGLESISVSGLGFGAIENRA
jgi:hypothetical protein